MIGALWRLFHRYVAPRWASIVFDDQWIISIIVCGVTLYFSKLKVLIRYELISQLVNYNLMAFGFTIAALAIVFAIPNAKFIEKMFRVAAIRPQIGRGPWEDIIFLMVWNGLVHFMALIASLSTMIFSFDYDIAYTPLRFNNSYWANLTTYGVYIIFQIYAMLNFLSTLIALFFFCSQYISSSKHVQAK